MKTGEIAEVGRARSRRRLILAGLGGVAALATAEDDRAAMYCTLTDPSSMEFSPITIDLRR